MSDIIKILFLQNNGIMASQSDDELSDNNDEWRNISIRERLALNSICTINNVKSSTFFTKGIDKSCALWYNIYVRKRGKVND